MKTAEQVSHAPASGPGAGSSSAAPAGEHLVAAILARWRAGEPADVRQALAQHPELTADKTLVLDLLLEAYTLHAAAGEPPDLLALCQQFPELAASIRKLLAADWFFAAHPELFDPLIEEPPPPPIPWPQEGEVFLGF